MVTLAKQVESLMKLRRISQADLAAKSGMHRANLCRYLAGETDIRVSSLMALLKALGLDCEELLTREIKKRSDSSAKTQMDSLGEAIEVLLENLDPIAAKTLLKTLLVRGQSLLKKDGLENALNGNELIENALGEIQSHCLNLQKSSRHSTEATAKLELERSEPA